MLRSDEIEIAVLNALYWDLAVPRLRVKVEVENRWVTIWGAVERPYQRTCAEADARVVPGVAGITNQIRLARRRPDWRQPNRPGRERMVQEEKTMSAIEKAVRERAYGNAGRPDDRSDEFWFAAKAEREHKQGTPASRLRAAVRPRRESSRHNRGHK